MADYAKPETVTLSDLQNRIKATDLVPSRTGLLENIDANFDKLSQQEIITWLDLQKSIKTPKQIEALSKEAGIDLQYLVLLRREVEGYHPKPFLLKDIDWVPQEVITTLVEKGITDSEALYSRGVDEQWRSDFFAETGIDREVLQYFVNLAGLCRVQWVSPNTARMLIEAGCENCHSLSAADGNELFKAMDRVNVDGKYFKGTIGLRDIKRLIEAARYFIN